MNFVDAAISLLRERGEPMHVEEICQLAIERELLARPGTNPLRSLKGRLTTESRKAGARVVKVDDDTWALPHGAKAEPVDEELPDEPPAPEEPAAEEPAPEEAPPAPQSPEEEEFARLYGDELGDTTPVAEVSEYRDEQTADEDRPMLPEIRADRRRRGKERRSRGRERGRERGRGRGKERDRQKEREPERETERAARPQPGVGAEHELADRAYRVLSSLKDGQAVRARQLAQMMKKRRLLSGSPERVEDFLRASLLAEENERVGRGLRPRVVSRGRDLFADGTSGLNEELLAAEEEVARAAARLEQATREALADHLGELKQPALERVLQLYLERVGWRDVEWIKRVGGASYATALPPGLKSPSLVGTRVGKKPIDRRGVGELRAGLTAKGLPRGFLITPQSLSDEALAELEKEGKPVTVVCGGEFLAALVEHGIGVVRRASPLLYLDAAFLDEIG